MKVVILAGGFGTRLSEYTHLTPKPMVPINGTPIIQRIMAHYAHHGFSEFLIALGYKGEEIKNYFANYGLINSDFSVDLGSGKIQVLKPQDLNWKVSLIDTGLETMTGGRLRALRRHLSNETFFATYGDGLSDVDINALLNFHRQHGKMVTVTAVRPAARFGELKIKDNLVSNFSEKPQVSDGWVNGGFFVMEPSFLELIEASDTVLEKEPFERAAEMGQMAAFMHEGFWQCMDTKRDKEYLDCVYQRGPSSSEK